ncbi:MAG: hypothetical protein ABJA71_08760 [Ginsengibacter sp.]
MKILKITFFTLFIITLLISCKKEFSLENVNIVTPGGTWEFQEGATHYSGNVDSSFIDGTGATKSLSIEGKSLSGAEEFLITLYATDSFTVGSYSTSISQAVFEYSTIPKTIFEGNFLTGEFTVNITSISNNTVTGTFSGQVADSTGGLIQITLGKFESTIDLSNNGSGNGTTTAIGTLGAAADTCTPITLAGTFTQGIALSASTNTVQVQVNVTAPGTFIIATNTINGVSFFKNGIFTGTGMQTVILEGTGIPVNAGIQDFTVTFGGNNCTFFITFLPGTLTDYFPTTINSTWAYGYQGDPNPADSFLTTVLPNAYTFGGKDYTAFSEDDIPPSGNNDTFFYRKSGGDYFQYFDLANYFTLDGSVAGEYVFLKDNVVAGTTFKSQDFTASVAGIPITIYIQGTITEKGVSETIGAETFNDVIKVSYEYFDSTSPGTPSVTEEKWFAKGIGLIYYNSDFYGGVVQIGRHAVL